MDPLLKVVALGACWLPLAIVAETAPLPHGDLVREGGFVLVLVAMIRLMLKHLAKRDVQVEKATQDFLGTQRALVQMAAERDQAIDAVGAQVAESFAECKGAIDANTAALADNARMHGQLHELLTACLRTKNRTANERE